MDELRSLSALEKLTDLRLKNPVRDLSNPVCMSETYKADVKSVLPKLVNLDGMRVLLLSKFEKCKAFIETILTS